MMPDLAYKIATAQSFNTKVNLGIQDIKVTYTVQATKGDKTITPDQIINLFLEDCFYRSKFSNKTDSEYKNNIKQIEKDEELRDKVFKQIGKQIESRIGQSSDWATGNAQISISAAEDKAKGESGIATFWKGLFDTDSSLILNNSDEETSNKDWTKKEIVALAELVYKGNLGEEITEDSGTDGDVESGIDNVKWPFIRSVKRHWYYKDIDFTKNTYRFATKATKTIDYESEDEDNILKTNNISVKLNATFQSDAGIIYQVCEPEATGPNASIIKVFRGRYYRYDGSALTAKKIANTKAIAKDKVTYKYNGEEYQVDNTQDMKVEKQKVNFKKNKTNTLVAFSILENVHTEAADYIYRNLKELVVKLGYFKESELAEELKNILLWPIQTDNQYSTWDVSKDENNWGSTIKCKNNENTVVAPSDAIVEKIEDNSITLKFTTINKDTVKLYDYIYNRIGDNKSYSDKSNDVKSDKNKSNKEQSDDEDIYTFTKINDNILTGMKITIKNIDIDSSIKVNQAISRGQELGTAKQGTDGSYEITITMQNVDKSVVDDLSDYFMQAHNTKYEEIMKYQMENSAGVGIDIGSFGLGYSSGNYSGDFGTWYMDLYKTSISREKWIELTCNYVLAHYPNAKYPFTSREGLRELYDIGAEEGLNPDFIVVRAIGESGLNDEGTGNFWGYKTPNGSSLASVGDWSTTLRKFAESIKSYNDPSTWQYKEIMQRYNERKAVTENGGVPKEGYGTPDTVSGIMSLYSWIGDKHIYGSPGSGGRYYLDPSRAGVDIYKSQEEYERLCANVHPDGSPTTVWEQGSYTAWQVRQMIKTARKIWPDAYSEQ